jgi:transcriptional regulator with XRE-family HTH domain
MPPRERRVDRGSRLARRLVASSGAEIRAARLSRGLTLEEVGRAVHLSYSQVGRIERGEHAAVSVEQLAKIGSVVGLDVSLRMYPGGVPLRDAAQLALLERFRRRLSADLIFRTEVPLPGYGDQRAWDAIILGAGDPVGIEAETRLTDVQAVERRIALKARDGGISRVILVIAGTRDNRAVVREASPLLAASFPIRGRTAMDALANGRDPGGWSLVLL